MSVAAVIVNYNAGDWLLRSVKSVLEDGLVQSVIVVDNCSKDDSIAQLTHTLIEDKIDHQRLKIITNDVNLGFGKANNQAINTLLDKPGIETILLINPDCELQEGVIKTLLPYFKKFENIGMLGCVIQNADGSIQSTCRRRFPTPMAAILRMTQLSRIGLFKGMLKQHEFDLGSEPMPTKMTEVDAISGAFMLVRKKAIQEVGVFDEEYFMHCEDLDWCKRFGNADWRIGFVPEVFVIHEKGVSSQARPVGVLWNLHKGMLRFFDKFYRDEYPWVFRVIVKFGIGFSFLLRAGVSSVRQLIFRVNGIKN